MSYSASLIAPKHSLIDQVTDCVSEYYKAKLKIPFSKKQFQNSILKMVKINRPNNCIVKVSIIPDSSNKMPISFDWNMTSFLNNSLCALTFIYQKINNSPMGRCIFLKELCKNYFQKVVIYSPSNAELYSDRQAKDYEPIVLAIKHVYYQALNTNAEIMIYSLNQLKIQENEAKMALYNELVKYPELEEYDTEKIKAKVLHIDGNINDKVIVILLPRSMEFLHYHHGKISEMLECVLKCQVFLTNKTNKGSTISPQHIITDLIHKFTNEYKFKAPNTVKIYINNEIDLINFIKKRKIALEDAITVLTHSVYNVVVSHKKLKMIPLSLMEKLNQAIIKANKNSILPIHIIKCRSISIKNYNAIYIIVSTQYSLISNEFTATIKELEICMGCLIFAIDIENIGTGNLNGIIRNCLQKFARHYYMLNSKEVAVELNSDYYYQQCIDVGFRTAEKIVRILCGKQIKITLSGIYKTMNQVKNVFRQLLKPCESIKSIIDDMKYELLMIGSEMIPSIQIVFPMDKYYIVPDNVNRMLFQLMNMNNIYIFIIKGANKDGSDIDIEQLLQPICQRYFINFDNNSIVLESNLSSFLNTNLNRAICTVYSKYSHKNIYVSATNFIEYDIWPIIGRNVIIDYDDEYIMKNILSIVIDRAFGIIMIVSPDLFSQQCIQLRNSKRLASYPIYMIRETSVRPLNYNKVISDLMSLFKVKYYIIKEHTINALTNYSNSILTQIKRAYNYLTGVDLHVNLVGIEEALHYQGDADTDSIPFIKYITIFDYINRDTYYIKIYSNKKLPIRGWKTNFKRNSLFIQSLEKQYYKPAYIIKDTISKKQLFMNIIISYNATYHYIHRSVQLTFINLHELNDYNINQRKINSLKLIFQLYYQTDINIHAKLFDWVSIPYYLNKLIFNYKNKHFYCSKARNAYTICNICKGSYPYLYKCLKCGIPLCLYDYLYHEKAINYLKIDCSTKYIYINNKLTYKMEKLLFYAFPNIIYINLDQDSEGLYLKIYSMGKISLANNKESSFNNLSLLSKLFGSFKHSHGLSSIIS